MAKAKKTDEATPGSIWKPLGEEFFLEGDFDSIAQGLGLEMTQVVYSITDEEQDGVAGHALSGVPA